MEQICDRNHCTGCLACMNICPVQAITVVEDGLGVSYPQINSEKCIDCKACEKVCPANSLPLFKYPTACYAAHVGKRKDPGRKICASGGVATALSAYWIEQKEGVVYGTRWNKDFMPEVCRVDRMEDLNCLKGSKYIQSNIGFSYQSVKEDLKQNIPVLFVGTPCQVAGLKNYLKKEYENLLLVDLICHGVSPVSYWRDEWNYLKSKHRFTGITDIRFRGNDRQNYRLSVWRKDQMLWGSSAYSQPYFSGFLKAVSLRENCYHCAYAQPARISDLTIGDFIGLGRDIPYPYTYSEVGNRSVVIVNTELGESFYEKVSTSISQFVSVKRDYQEAVKYGPSLRAPFPHHSLTDKFRSVYVSEGWVKAIRKTLGWSCFQNKWQIRMSYLWRVPCKICRIILKGDKL